MLNRVFWSVVIILCFGIAGFAQTVEGVITGRVEDTSGARIPGVSVALSSRAIQGDRSVISDENGGYRFPGLPPGTYTVKYELAGFGTLVREGILVEVGRTVTLVVQLQVATVAETVTVSGESPVVDLEQATIGINFSSVLKDNLISARDYYQIAGMTPGFKSTTIDVGGSTVGTGAGYRAYGRSGQVQFSLDGVNSTEGSASASVYGDFGSYEEIEVSAAGNSAEMNSGGAQFVAVIKTGANQVHSSLLYALENKKFQSDNLDDNLRRTGLTIADKFTRLSEFNGDIGGPFMKDKFWYYTSYRHEYVGLQTQMRQNNGKRYVLPASGIAPPLCSQLPCVGDNPDGAANGADFYTRLRNLTAKLNFQINANNQVIAYANARHKYQPYRGGDGSGARTQTPDTTQVQDSWFHTFKAQWLSTISAKTTLDISLNNFGYYWRNSAQVDEVRIQDRGTTGPTRDYLQGGFRANIPGNRRRWHENFILSHFANLAGSHNIKAGYAFQWEDQRSSTVGYKGHVLYQFNNGLPDRVLVDNTPTQWQQNGLFQNYFFIQDKWQIGRRLTANIGFRFDRYRNFLPEQIRESAGANPFNAATDIPGLESFGNKLFPKRDIATFNNPVPRLAFIYDMFGDGKTAVKFSYGRFSNNPADGLSSTAQDNDLKTATYSWNGTLPFTVNYLRQCINDTNTATRCTIITRPAVNLTRIDPNLRNSYITEFTAGIDQQLFNDWNVRFDFVRKIDEGAYGSINMNYTEGDYAPFQFRDPGRDGVAETADDSIVTLYNRLVPTRTNDPFVTYIDGSGDLFRTWEIAAQRRFKNKWQMLFGADWTKRDLGANLFTTDPNTTMFRNAIDGSHFWDWTVKLMGTYELPRGIKLSSVYKSQNGEAESRTIQVDCNRVVARNQTCAQAGGAAPLQGSFTQTVENTGTHGLFFPTVHLVDLSVGKIFTLEKYGKFEGSVDIFNLTNSNVIRGWANTSSTTGYADGSIGPTFQKPSSILNPRILRFTVKWDF